MTERFYIKLRGGTMTVLEQMGQNAKAAARQLATAGALKNTALLAMAKAIEENEDAILSANALDVAAARENGMTDSLIDRLTLNHTRVQGMAQGIRAVAAQN